MRSVELFTGAGGLGMGLALAGFRADAVIEWDRWACDAVRENQQRGFPLVADWPLFAGDVRAFEYESLIEKIDLVAGGPPCQPSSICGKHQGYRDDRDMFPATVEVVRKLRPRAFIVENVKGLTRSAFANYFQYVLLQFEFPEIAPKWDEPWDDHLRRLQRRKTSGKRVGLCYNVVSTLVNAANFDVPQKRERVFIVGFRDDQHVRWSFPKSTHSLDALVVDQWVTGEYWDRHGRVRPPTPAHLRKQVEYFQRLNRRPNLTSRPWRTVRDALVGLPDPERSVPGFHNHKFQPGARSYIGHTGSLLDLPAKALKAGDHGVPGGENMMIKDDGLPRYFTVRESARIQTFPDGYVLHGAWSEAMRQLGNAVPVTLAHLVAASVARNLLERDFLDLASTGGPARRYED
jgi:DNA (cytosine-5)-methyltransferase 1